MSKFVVEVSERIKTLPPYLFAKIDEMKEVVRKQGVDIIDLGVGDPDLPTPKHIIERLKNDEYLYFKWDEYILTIEFDRYHFQQENIYNTDRVTLWVANDIDSLEFYSDMPLREIPDELKPELWEVLNTTRRANILEMKYRDYIKQQDKEKMEKEIKKRQKIKEAKKLLKEEGLINNK